MSTEFDFDESYEAFVREVEPRLHDALSASLGNDLGREATAEVLAYAWEHWSRLSQMSNPAGYLYVRGRERGRRQRRQRPVALMPAPESRTRGLNRGCPMRSVGCRPSNGSW